MSPTLTKTVLIVDNDKLVRDTLVEMVHKMGHKTVAFERATRAAGVLANREVDAILLDLHMPGPHGQDLLRYWKKHNINIPPTIVVSGYLKEEAIGELLKLGVCGVIAKPFDAKRLRDELGRVLEGRDKQDVFFCSDCGKPARDMDRFCRYCGEKVVREKNCSACEAAYSPGDRFCGECGAKIAQ